LQASAQAATFYTVSPSGSEFTGPKRDEDLFGGWLDLPLPRGNPKKSALWMVCFEKKNQNHTMNSSILDRPDQSHSSAISAPRSQSLLVFGAWSWSFRRRLASMGWPRHAQRKQKTISIRSTKGLPQHSRQHRLNPAPDEIDTRAQESQMGP